MKYSILLLILMATTATSAECVDTDGDGWGWTGTESCKIEQLNLVQKPEIKQCVDTDGDGWGWDGTESCRMDQNKPPSTLLPLVEQSAQCVDTDNDGWGWNGTSSCEVTQEVKAAANLEGITDVVVMMGQSNALGNGTLVNLVHDYADERILAWTKNDGWQVADLCTQVWRGNWYPWQGGACGNHPAFQIAKGIIAQDPARKIAIIPAGDAGKPISSWNENAPSLQLVKDRIEAALTDLPNTDKLDLVAWSQGESDHGNELNWYNSLTDLVYRLRNEAWFDASTTRFIAQETSWSSVNDVVTWLDSDNDPLTGAVLAADQPLKDIAHFTGDALRTIGERYAVKYLQMGG